MLIPSCATEYGRPKYINRVSHKHKRVILFKTGTYRNPIVKPETKRNMVKPKSINFDKW
jgi:hypothetical protein